MNNSELKAYRKLALIHFEKILRQQPEPDEADEFVDRYIRLLSKLAERPAGSPLYQGLYGAGSTLDQYRDVATDRLLELVYAVTELDKVDEGIDKYIRILSKLPERPQDVKPYVRLFKLADDDGVSIQSEVSPPSHQFVMAEQLIQIAGTDRFSSRIQALTPGVNATLERYKINTKLRIAHFLAQIMHESGGFQWLRELWGPNAIQEGYEGRRDLGNTQSGDGKRFMGRGLIQLTGRANYQKFTEELGKELGVNFVEKPELVEQPPYGVMVAGWYWNSRNINIHADKDDLRKVTLLINGGTNGIEDRRNYLDRARVVLKDSQFKRLVPQIATLSIPQNLHDLYTAKLELHPEMIADNEDLAKSVQERLVYLGFLDPPADGKFGPISTKALQEFQEIMQQKIPDLAKEKGFMGAITAKALIETSPQEIPKPELRFGNDLASRLIQYLQKKEYQIAINPGEYNIVYVEGMDSNGQLNNDQPNFFNDIRMVIDFQNGQPRIVKCWEATTEPGNHYTYNPISAYARQKGAARIQFGQYKAWRVGTHGNAEPHEALVQAGEITVCRDFNKDMKRTGDKLDTGTGFGINQHYGFDMPRNNIGMASAGCLVGRTRSGHREFMKIIKQDKRYQQNRSYLFQTTVIDGEDLEKHFPST